MTTEKKINNLADLQREREIVRGQINHQEEILKDHYTSFAEKFKPAMRILNFISGNRFFKGANKDENGESMDWTSILLKIVLAGGIGGFMLKNSKKNFMRAMLAFALDQGAKFIKEKDISSYIEKIKEWLKKKEKESVETEEELSGK